jgi:hypothetical protein
MSPRIVAREPLALAMLALPLALMDKSAAQQPSREQVEAIRESCRSDFISHCPSVQPGGREALECLQRNTAQLSPTCSSAVGAAAPTTALPPAVAGPQTHSSPPQPSQATAPDQLGAMRHACTLDDFLSHCSWIQPSSPELLLCLRANAAKVSLGCQAALRGIPDAATAGPGAAPAPDATPPAAAAPLAPAAPPAAATAPATAAPKQPTPQQLSAVRTACRSDFIAYCSGVQPGTPTALNCLQRNSAQASRACQVALAALGGGTTGVEPAPPSRGRGEFGILRACAANIRTLCGDVPPGGGRLVACLARNTSELRPECRAALAQMRR